MKEIERSCDTRDYTLVGVGAGHKILSDTRQEKKERGKEKCGVITITGADYMKRVDKYHDSTVVVVVVVSRNDLRREAACVIFLSAEITHRARCYVRAHLRARSCTSPRARDDKPGRRSTSGIIILFASINLPPEVCMCVSERVREKE